MKSLRLRLLLTLLPATLLVWLVAGVVSYKKASREAVEMLDGQLAQSAKLLMAQIHYENQGARQAWKLVESLQEGELHPYEQPLEFQIWGADGALWMRSGNSPVTPMARKPGYQEVLHDGRPWRMLATWSPRRDFQVQVAQSLADRERVALEVATQVGMPIVIALPLLGLLIYLAVRRAMLPLETLAHGVAARTPDNLEDLPGNNGVPTEVKPLVLALNHLLSRLRIALENERRFTADAAHELRTPLAALKIQAQVALASVRDEDRLHALRQVLVGTDRAARLVDQLLRLARLDPLEELAREGDVGLGALAEQLVAEMTPIARQLGKSLNLLDAPDQVSVRADSELLRLALRNLVENALVHTPAGCEVSVGACLESGLPVLWVRDTGPGVAADELPHLTERFVRGRDVTQEGSGLGLAIVKRVAELHHARLALTNHPEGGLWAKILWTTATV